MNSFDSLEKLHCLDNRYDFLLMEGASVPDVLAILQEKRWKAYQRDSSQLTIDQEQADCYSKYDQYYNHIIVVDRQLNRMIGGCRVASMSSVVNKYGKEYLYSASVFDMEDSFVCDEGNCELGALFFDEIPNINRAIFGLMNAIAIFVERDPTLHKIVGFLSISCDFPKEAIDAVICFYNHYFGQDIESIEIKNKKDIYSPDLSPLAELLAPKGQSLPYKDGLKLLISYLKEKDCIFPFLFQHYPSLFQLEGFKVWHWLEDPVARTIDAYASADASLVKPFWVKRFFKGGSRFD